jgi:hypothetical protein
MTDEQIAEIYSLGRESFFGGQKSFQLQAYPFKMTPINMAKHRSNPNMPFWKMIKEGYDHFEVTKQEPKVDFCEKKYVFDAIRAPNATREPVFEASSKCPAYAIPEEIADAVREKQQAEAAETTKLISRGTPMARMNTGIDGGMNKVFAARVPEGNTGLSEGGDGQSLSLLSLARAPGTIPSHVNPPRAPSDNLLLGAPQEPKLAAAPASAPAAAPAPTRVANAAPAEQQSGGWFSSLARKVGIGGNSEATASTPPPAAAAAPSAKPKVIEAKRSEPAPKPAAPKAEPKQAASRPPLKPTVAADPPPAQAAAAAPAQVAGSAPIVSSNSFDSRFSAMK